MAERQLDRKILTSQKEDVALGRKLLANVENSMRRQDKWIPITEEYLRGCEEALELLINKGRGEVVGYILQTIKDKEKISGKNIGKQELWKRIQTSVPKSWASIFDAVFLAGDVDTEAAEARFVGAWGIVSDFGVLDSQYSFLSPERNGIIATRVNQIHNTARTTREKYRH